MSCPISRIVQLVAMLLGFVLSGLATDALPRIETNQNHAPAGVLRDGVLTIHLEIGKGDWYPEADDGIALAVYAFGQTGHALQNPGPLIRVPQGTEIHATVHNSLDVPITVHGLGESTQDPVPQARAQVLGVDVHSDVRIGPGATEQVTFKATTRGLFYYWGAAEVNDVKLRHSIDSELTGALVVDPPGASTNDEIFVLEMISEFAGLASRETLATINGKSWPYTQRFQYDLGQPVHWRWINATNEPHALHLHGFYYRVDAINRDGRVHQYEPDSRPMVVTQRIAQGETFDMSWSPDRPGRWLFHCHMLQHMIPPTVPKALGLSIRQPAHNSTEHSSMHAADMGQLVLGITVPDKSKSSSQSAWHADRKLQLVVTERTGLPRYALQVHDPADPAPAHASGLIGPPIVLTQNEPVEIEVINKLTQPTAIHWHGIELDSYYDGVPGWTGTATQTTPPIAPGTSFVARMRPPRAGTFIYHTHWHDESQLTNGLYGALIVLPPGQKFDSTSDLPFVFSIGNFSGLGDVALINGTPQSKALQLQAGKKYRFRLINISTNNQAMQVSLRSPNGPVEWRVIAKDGADLPPSAIQSSKAQLTVTVGETYDVEFFSATPQDLLLDLFLPGQKIHASQTLALAPATAQR